MKKTRTTKHSRDSFDEAFSDAESNDYTKGDDPIGLTQAFAPIPDEDDFDYSAEQRKRAGEYTKGDDPIGLTQAFAPIGSGRASHARWDAEADDGASNEPSAADGVADATGAADGTGAWQTASDGAAPAFATGVQRPVYEAAPTAAGAADSAGAAADPANANANAKAAAASYAAGERRASHARGFSYQGDQHEDYPDALSALEPVDAPPLLVNEKVVDDKGDEGRHAAKTEEPPHLRRSRRVRKTLIVVIVLLVALVAALLFFGFHAVVEGNSIASQQAQSRSTMTTASGNDATSATNRTTDVPNLTGLLGLSQDAAIEQIGHGATVTSTRSTSDNGAIVSTVSVALSTEPADSKVGLPTVYLGLDESGAVIQVGYSASAASLGFSTQSFSDAVNSTHVIEKALQAIGVNVSEGAVTLPSDRSAYTTYASDGTTVARERCSFSGEATVNGIPCTWSSVLSYDYTTANLTGDLSDTVRVIYVYVTENTAQSASTDSAGE
jgi:hypothetical protein